MLLGTPKKSQTLHRKYCCKFEIGLRSNVHHGPTSRWPFFLHPLKSKRPDVAWSSGHPPRGEVSGRLPGTGPRKQQLLTCKRSFKRFKDSKPPHFKISLRPRRRSTIAVFLRALRSPNGEGAGQLYSIKRY